MNATFAEALQYFQGRQAFRNKMRLLDGAVDIQMFARQGLRQQIFSLDDPFYMIQIAFGNRQIRKCAVKNRLPRITSGVSSKSSQ